MVLDRKKKQRSAFFKKQEKKRRKKNKKQVLLCSPEHPTMFYFLCKINIIVCTYNIIKRVLDKVGFLVHYQMER